MAHRGNNRRVKTSCVDWPIVIVFCHHHYPIFSGVQTNLFIPLEPGLLSRKQWYPGFRYQAGSSSVLAHKLKLCFTFFYFFCTSYCGASFLRVARFYTLWNAGIYCNGDEMLITYITHIFQVFLK